MATVTTPTAPIGAGLAPARSRRVTATALYGVRVPTISRRARPCGRARGLLSVRAASSLPDDQRVVITGAGVVSTAGNDRESFFDSLLRGESGVIDLTAWRPGVFDDLPTRIGAPILDLSPGADLTPKEVRRMDKVHQYAVCAGKRALRDAGLWGDDLDALDKTKCGVLLGSAMGGMQVYEDNVVALTTKGIKKVSPFTVPYMLTNMSGAILGMQAELGFRGPNYAVNTACATSNYQFINAAQHIRAGQADVILAGGAEAAVTPMGLGGFIACKALSKRNDDPTAASRPWDKGRDGFVMGEGAGVLVMESLAHAKKRGARILAEYLGGGISTDAYDLTSPRADGRDVILCMRSALADAGVEAGDVDLVNAHGTSTPVGDLCEVAAVNEVFGARDASTFKLNSTKSMLGHQLGASGALEAIACLESIRVGAVHPTINHEEPEEGVKFDVVPNEAREFKVGVALSNSFGFGGHNSSVVFGKFEE
jgi:3-oxoacyl-[acyl-carrier-protein] synthase II